MTESIQEEYVDQIRNADSVARRCVVLYGVMAVGYAQPRDPILAWLRKEKLWDAVSPKEAVFLESVAPTQRQIINATWRSEALLPLLWALGLVPELAAPTGTCDLPFMIGIMPPPGGSVDEWLSRAQLRKEPEIRNANESIYQIHWSVRDAQLNGRPVPSGFHPGVVLERHYALNWLIGYCTQDWDDITTDT